MTESPDIIPVGGSVHLVSLKSLARAFGYRGDGPAGSLLKGLGIPTREINGTKYFNLFMLERKLFMELAPEDVRARNAPEAVDVYMAILALTTKRLKRRVTENWLKELRPLKNLHKSLQTSRS